MAYLEKECKHGSIIEVEKYTSGRYGKKKNNGTPAGETPPEQIKWQVKNDIKKVWRILGWNFKPGDWWIFLSFKPKYRPKTPAEGKSTVQKFFRKLRVLYEKEGQKLKYVFSAGRTKGGAFHLHMVINKFDAAKISDLWADIANNGEYSVKTFTPLEKKKDWEAVASYLIKNGEEDFNSDNPTFKKRFCNSSNLKIKKVKPKIVKAKQWRKEPPERKGYYIDKERSYSGFNSYGYPVQYTVYVELSTKDSG